MLQADSIVQLAAGRYRLCERLAGSSYGIVWRAVRECNGESLALKFINADQMARAAPGLRQRWLDSAASEMRLLGSLAPWDARHIVRMLDSGHHQGLPVLALELLDGSLDQEVAGEPVPLTRALGWLAQVNQALARIHQAGWCYLDLKPANLLRYPDGSLRLTDFGTSRRIADGPSVTYAGTPSWQAPEQFFPNPSGQYPCDIRSDYFALGLLLHHLVTGGRQLRYCAACADAFKRHGSAGGAWLRARHAGAVPTTLHDDEAALVARLAGDSALRLLRALLAPEPGRRPASALAISRMLAEAGAARYPLRRAA
ncbi:MAG: serine/threonine-protein kinase [Gammaproteobacteria bacterium]